MTILRCHQVRKTFDGRKYVLEGIDFSIEEEEFILFTGPPGAGKTTLLSILGGYMEPSEGEVLLLDKNMFAMSAFEEAQFRKDHIGAVFQRGRLIPALTVLENVMIAMSHDRGSKEKALTILSYMGMEEKHTFYPEQLSGAEMGLVALSRALVNEPKLLILDEPTQFLDHQTSMKVMTYLRQMAIDHQITVIAALNDIRLYPFASRIFRMKGGRIIDTLGDTFQDAPFIKL